VPDPFPVYFDWEREADVDTVNDVITYSTHIDTAIVYHRDSTFNTIMVSDTVAVISQDISLTLIKDAYTEGLFNVLMNIELKPIEKIITITEIVYQTVIKEVAASPPFYNTWIVGFISGVIMFLILAISLL